MRTSHSSLGFALKFTMIRVNEGLMVTKIHHLSSFPWLVAPRKPPLRGAKPLTVNGLNGFQRIRK